jgi:hypothetical protein
MFAAPPGAKPFEPFSGKARMLKKAGTRDAGPSALPPALVEQPSVQFPAGIERKRAL